jgi:GxxExxY protein
MNAKQGRLKHRLLTEKIIGIFFDVYNELKYGFLESVYEASMSIALNECGLHADRQVAIPVSFRGHLVGDFRADLLVCKAVIVEVKAARSLDTFHEAQLLNYLRASELEVGLLLNFGREPQFRRMIFDMKPFDR